MHRAILDEGGYTGGVIATIFETLESSDEDWIGVIISYVPNNSAHTDLLIVPSLARERRWLARRSLFRFATSVSDG
jgi:hypothetical protein